MADPLGSLHIVGAGRAGLALGSALLAAGAVRRVSYGGRAAHPPAHPLFQGTPPAAAYAPGVADASVEAPSAVLLAVPDDSITTVAVELARLARWPAATPVLHLSGVAAGADLLAPLAQAGHPVGSIHPMAALPDAEAASRLRGAWFAVEGAPQALRVGRAIVAVLEGRALEVAPGGKALYHAAAVAASNHVVALLSVAERWMEEAGVPAAEARDALAALADGAVRSVARLGPPAALTGPVARGDVETIRAHLSRLSGTDRHLYSVLSRTTLTLARQRGLDTASADEIARLLEATE